jgi:FkbM family methyltransferase
MPDHGWWKTFAGGWEHNTERAYRRLLRPGATVVDVGAWIGPTVMFACACRARRILAIEPNPACRRYLDVLQAHLMAHGTELIVCSTGIHAAAGEVDFGTTSGELMATSAASLRGTGARVRVDRLPEVLAKFGFESPTLIKIDIEGAEFIIADQLRAFSAAPATRIFLSLHPGLEPEPDRRNALVAALAAFDLYDTSLNPITLDVVAARIKSEEPFPKWGTEYGNFFEVLLVPRGERALA